MNGETTFLDEFNATAPDLSREVNVMVVGGSGPTPSDQNFGVFILCQYHNEIFIDNQEVL